MTRDERDAVISAAKAHGLNTADLRRIHADFLKCVALGMLANGPLSDADTSELAKVAKLLGLGADAVMTAITEAQNDADELATLILSLTNDERATQSATKALGLRGILQPKRWLAPIAVGASTIASMASLLSKEHEIHCVTCKRVTEHSLLIADDFPIQEWLKLAWQAKSLSPSGFLVNAATLAVSDMRLMEQTGTSLLPKFQCSSCSTNCGRLDSARTLLGVFSRQTE